MVALSSGGFTLLSDHVLRRFQLDVPASAGHTDEERNLIIGAIFEQIEESSTKPLPRTERHRIN